MHSLLPRPQSAAFFDGVFAVNAETTVSCDAELGEAEQWLRQMLQRSTGLPLLHKDGEGSITLSIRPGLGAEDYRLEIDERGVRIGAGARQGAFYAAHTLLQLLPPAVYRMAPAADEVWELPYAVIKDSPRFAWRGVMLDVARHFMPKHDVLRFIDLMAMHRLNVLHWHLTDDQGWRVEIRRHPRLTEVGGWRTGTQVGPPPASPVSERPHGGFYTQDDIREIVAYARARQIEIVPEIDVPGHTQAAIAAYPELGVGGRAVPVATRWGVMQDVLNVEESTVSFFEQVFDEVMALFPGQYIGIGGDECPKDQWREDPRTQDLIRERGLSDEHDLQSWFMRRISDHIVSQGRRPYGWDELLEGDARPETVIASWRGMTGAATAIRRGFDVVACPDDRVYLDYRQSELPDEPIPFAIPLTLSDAYSFQPVPQGASPADAEHVLGGQANVWTEHMDSPRTVDYYVFPRLCAIAEVLWGTAEDFPAFQRRLAGHLGRLDAVGVEYRHADGPAPWQTRPEVAGRPSTRSEHEALIAGLVANIA